jgi:type III pantothenate kinase
MQAGIMFGAVEMIDGLVGRIKKEIDVTCEIKVIATGGLASSIMEQAVTIQHFEPYLTLDGMRLIYNRVKKN